MTNNIKQERRYRRTEALILNGLTTLLQQKSIKEITVRELADLVDINRSTFYLHYTDIYDLLEKTEQRLVPEPPGRGKMQPAVAAAAGRGKPELDLAGNAEKLFRVSGTGFHHSLGKCTALFCPDRTERRHCLFTEH